MTTTRSGGAQSSRREASMLATKKRAFAALHERLQSRSFLETIEAFLLCVEESGSTKMQFENVGNGAGYGGGSKKGRFMSKGCGSTRFPSTSL
ncbi:hypothetical protein HPP92_028349 [Vanilla planifolia]|uniref:Uncharacterized protein n=1 Tax=Vanilla planifolia TaxID=51239 RepID=A0A835P7J5_VANPL|nr:hypothetical protein HPP92_028349 [Vanilla planifolia]